ncbi:DUF3885 domain-containing protein [Pseudomonas entomophila]|uniref:DUF3885 domain-containing protein n=1 Tax=Pseudomonas entomophila TaxID=312306 RepID=UPI0023D843C4|nr:DUF3885 domain-containing protein [Pseudomonas entomophila]MDF0732408.1 DUF3885 domain-containing protein [Pseudomonas entomophila]
MKLCCPGTVHRKCHGKRWSHLAVGGVHGSLTFEVPVSLLETLLWCALAKDFRVIQPNPGCDVYLFNLNNKILAFPYDDRGMDVVGSNRELLFALYEKHQRYLLESDHPEISAMFSAS